MPNRLAASASPYLLQHKDNPVDWQEWSDAAFAEARDRDVPVLLSVGYASCHWCHVMAHESFEDEATAEVMNRWFVNVKVDREERPDIDRVYMAAVQAMTGRGGWPMTLFLTHDGKPFFAGTYFPRVERPGHPSFVKVLEAIHDAWMNRRGDVTTQGERLAEAVSLQPGHAEEGPTEDSFVAAHGAVQRSFDPIYGGFGGAPKFPQAPTLEFLLRSASRPWAPEAVRILSGSLAGMARGGIRDRIGGGFARYSVDAMWRVPHFEKMLYDNALLGRLYALAAGVCGEPAFAEVAGATLDYMIADLRLEDGGFASGEDADSEGEEGTFYVFDFADVAAAAGELAVPVTEALGVTEGGNFEGRNVLYDARPIHDVAADAGIEEADLRAAVARTLDGLRRLRATRPRPGRDDKVVTAWNGLAVRALAESGVVLGRPDYVAAAEATADFLLEHLRRDDGRLLRTWRRGKHGPIGFCDDYAALALGCFALYQATGAPRWFSRGAELTEAMVDLFHDDAHSGFLSSGHDAERLIASPKDLFDNPVPSDNALAAEAALHMAAFTGEDPWWRLVDEVLRLGMPYMSAHPHSAGHLLSLAVTVAAPPLEVALVGDIEGVMSDVVQEEYRPFVFLAKGDPTDGVPLLADRTPLDASPTAYVCRGFVCESPTTDPAALRDALSAAG